LRLRLALVRSAEEHGPAQVAALDRVRIEDKAAPYAGEREELEDLVAERASPDHEHARRRDARLVPPRDEALAVIAILLEHLRGERGDVHGAKPPAVISGWMRSTSPSTTSCFFRSWSSRSCTPRLRWWSL